MKEFEPTLPGIFPIFDPETAEALKAAGVQQAAENDATTTAREIARVCLLRLASRRYAFTSDEVYELAELAGTPLPDNLNLGSVFNTAHKRKQIEAVWCPSRPSKRRLSHARLLKVWIGCGDKS